MHEREPQALAVGFVYRLYATPKEVVNDSEASRLETLVVRVM